jgi:hypothetical protein
MSTFLFSEICCSKISTAISVPVLPTPALKQKNIVKLYSSITGMQLEKLEFYRGAV